MCDDHDYPTVFVETHPRARKRWLCCECTSPIVPGERYQRAFGVWDRSPDTHVTCLLCAWLRDAIVAADFCPTYGGLCEAVDAYEGGELTSEIGGFRERLERGQAALFGVMRIPPPRPPRDLQPMESDPW